jgi:hypothetical protein
MLPGGAPDGCSRPAFRWLVRLVAVSAVVLVPWAAYLADTLPSSISARHWPLAWTGLDIAMAAGRTFVPGPAGDRAAYPTPSGARAHPPFWAVACSVAEAA